MSIVERIGNASLIICGVFNTIQNETLDYFNYKTIKNKKSHEKKSYKLRKIIVWLTPSEKHTYH